MSQNSTIRTPTPIGGVPMDFDQIPSIIFAAMYGLLFPLVVYRWVVPGTRTVLLLNVTFCTVERVVVYAFRARQAFDPDLRNDWGILKYLQLSLMGGWIQCAQDAGPLLRCLVINASGGPHHLEPTRYRHRTDGTLEDRPRERNFARRAGDVFTYLWFAAIIPGVVSGFDFGGALTDQKKADRLQFLRYFSAIVAMTLMAILVGAILTAMSRLPHINRKACIRLLVLVGLMLGVGTYRLAVMKNRIPELLYTGDGSLQSKTAKICFYLIHCVPEFAASALLLVPNTRNDFQTGPWGDWRQYDGQKGIPEAIKEARDNIEAEKRRKAERRDGEHEHVPLV